MRLTVRGAHARTASQLALGVALALGLVFSPACKTVQRDDAPLAEGVVLAELNGDQTAALGAYVAALYSGGAVEPPALLAEGQGSAYVALRGGGELLAEVWGKDGSLAASLEDAMTKAKAMVEGGTPDAVELNLAHTFQSVTDPNPKNLYRLASGKRTGIRGIELRLGEHYERVPPTKMLAAGDRFGTVVKRFFEVAGVDHAGFVAGGGQARVFEVQQFIVGLPSGESTKLLRGNVYVEPSAVTRAGTQATTDLLIDWMLKHLHEDGRMTYMWLPGESREVRRQQHDSSVDGDERPDQGRSEA